MNTLYKLTVFAGVAAAISVSVISAPAVAQQQASNCPKLSDVEWWTNTVPEVRRVVQASYNGNWDAYIDRWKQQQRDLQQAYNSGQSVEIKSRGLVFRNDDLKEYIGQVEERVKTLECLKREFAADDQAALPKGAVSSQGTSPRQGAQAQAAAAKMALGAGAPQTTAKPVIDKYCVGCHNEKRKAQYANLALDSLEARLPIIHHLLYQVS